MTTSHRLFRSRSEAMRGAIKLALLASLAGVYPAAKAEDLVAYRAFREARFADVKKAHPDQERQIADIKAKTAAMLASQPAALGSVDQPPAIWNSVTTPVIVFDDPIAPRMLVVPAGEYTMGSPKGEDSRAPHEGPQHRVRIAHAFAVSMFPITYGEYAFFIGETHRPAAGNCVTFEDGAFGARAGRDWENPGYTQNVRNPAACVSFEDAKAYTAWLSKRTGQHYRLLSEAEYEYAERAGSATPYWWGKDRDSACDYANGFDLDAPATLSKQKPLACHDKAPLVSELGTHKANAFGLFDMAGNVASWTEDCWNDNYRGAPLDGSTRLTGDCHLRVLRGGSWASADLRSASRDKDRVDYVAAHHGFRIARDL